MDGKKKNRRGKIAWILCAIAAAACIMIAVYQHSRRQAVSGSKHITIEVQYEDGKKDSYSVDTDAAYLKEAAASVLTIDGKDTSYGYEIDTINGVTADYSKDKAYWAIYVNGEYGTSYADSQPVEDGADYRFAYEKG